MKVEERRELLQLVQVKHLVDECLALDEEVFLLRVGGGDVDGVHQPVLRRRSECLALRAEREVRDVHLQRVAPHELEALDLRRKVLVRRRVDERVGLLVRRRDDALLEGLVARRQLLVHAEELVAAAQHVRVLLRRVLPDLLVLELVGHRLLERHAEPFELDHKHLEQVEVELLGDCQLDGRPLGPLHHRREHLANRRADRRHGKRVVVALLEDLGLHDALADVDDEGRSEELLVARVGPLEHLDEEVDH